MKSGIFITRANVGYLQLGSISIMSSLYFMVHFVLLVNC